MSAHARGENQDLADDGTMESMLCVYQMNPRNQQFVRIYCYGNCYTNYNDHWNHFIFDMYI